MFIIKLNPPLQKFCQKITMNLPSSQKELQISHYTNFLVQQYLFSIYTFNINRIQLKKSKKIFLKSNNFKKIIITYKIYEQLLPLRNNIRFFLK